MGWYMDDDQLCEDIIEYHKNSPLKTLGCVGAENGQSKVDKSSKDSVDTILDYDLILINKYYAKLQQCINRYVDKYEYSAKYRFSNQETTNVQYYPPNGGYHMWHMERTSYITPLCNRHLVFMTYLNDVHNGGETEFYYQKMKVKPEKGLTLIWGSDWTFTHRGCVAPEEDKYIVTGWMHYSQ